MEPRCTLVTVLTIAWAARLGIYLYWRNAGKGEDPRYTGLLVWLISAPVQLAQYLVQPPALGPAAFAGVALWTIGFLFEAIADWQLARFKGNAANSGRVLDHGLWRYSRHPNYFGNACLWWGLWLIACDHLVGLATVFAPILMTHFLLNVTGKKLLEKRMSRARPEYAAYIARTPGFFPWFPRGF